MTSTTLYFRQGSSDKVYAASIQPAGALWNVTFAYGRRGTTMQTGLKTSVPVSYDKARKVYDRLLKEKMAKGYTPGPSGSPYTGTAQEASDTGIHCQLLNPIDEKDLHDLLRSPDFSMQEKHDGRRILVRKDSIGITGINRRGLQAALPISITLSAQKLPHTFIIDGEAVGDTLHAFDLLELNGTCLRDRPYCYRLDKLHLLLGNNGLGGIRVIHTARTSSEKAEMYRELLEAGKEGVVFKDITAVYTAGRPNSGGAQLKFKFQKTASCLVTGMNIGKRSVPLGLLRDKNIVPCGNVTVPANYEIPGEGAVVEVRYLYAMPGSNALYQPLYLGPRDDMTADDCVLSQLSYKAA